MKLIAETAWHHQGDFAFMQKLVSSLSAEASADVLKLHLTLDQDEYMLSDHPLYDAAVKWLFEKSQWQDIINIIRSGSKEFMVLCNDTKAIEFAMSHSPALVEIHSVCLNDINLLDALKQNIGPDTRVVFGIGGSTLDEIDNAINLIQTPNIVLMFGFQNYPTRYEDVNFSKMRRIMGLYPEYCFGYADHTAGDEPNNLLITLMGAALGMDYIEKHVTIAYGEERADWSAAISVDMCNELRRQLDLLQACNGSGRLALNRGERAYSVFGMMKKAAVMACDGKKGDTLARDMLLFRRTGQSTDLSQVDALQCIGSHLSCDIKKGQILSRHHVAAGTSEQSK